MRSVEEIMDDTACDFGHFNWQCLSQNVIAGIVEVKTLVQIVTEVAKEYSRDAEKYYTDNSRSLVYCPTCGNTNDLNTTEFYD